MSDNSIIRVEVITGPMDGLGHYTLNGRLVVGRSRDADLQLLHDPLVNASHAELYFKDGLLFLKDLESPSGTWIGDTKLSSGVNTPITVGVTFAVGNTMIEVVDDEEG